MTWEPYIDYLKARNSSPTTIADYSTTFRRFFSSYDELTAETVKAFLNVDLAASTRAKYRLQLRGLAEFLRLSIDWRYDVPQIKHGTEAPLVFSEVHEQLVYRYIADTDFVWVGQGRFYADIFRLLIHTGLRISEAKYLKPDDLVDGAVPHILVRKAGGRSHSKDGRIVPLDEVALEILRHYELPLRFSPKTLTRLLVESRREFNLPAYSLHVCRKTWATRAIRRGVPITALCAAGGWSSPATLMFYAGRSAETLYEAFLP